MAWVPPSQVLSTTEPTVSSDMTDSGNAIDVAVTPYDDKAHTSSSRSGITGSIVIEKYA